MTADSIDRLKITLHDVEPPVMRRIELPLTILPSGVRPSDDGLQSVRPLGATRHLGAIVP